VKRVLTRLSLLCACTLGAVTMGAGSLAAQDGLYAPSVPEDAALIRVVNATAEERSVDLGPLRFRDLAPSSASAYRPVAPGIFVVGHAGERTVVEPAAQSFLSVIVHEAGVTVIADERHTDPARAQLVLYNVSPDTVDFRALAPEAMLAPAVEPGGSAARAVNAIRVEVGAFVGDEVGFAAEIDLRRGESYALVFTGRGGRPAGFIVEAAVASE
jgi:hypothetical protein